MPLAVKSGFPGVSFAVLSKVLERMEPVESRVRPAGHCPSPHRLGRGVLHEEHEVYVKLLLVSPLPGAVSGPIACHKELAHQEPSGFDQHTVAGKCDQVREGRESKEDASP